MTIPTDPAAEALAAADGYLAVLAQYRHAPGTPFDPAALANGPAGERMIRATNDQPPEVRAAVAARLAAGIPGLPDPLAAGLLAIQLGGRVEGGADPAPLAEALRTRLPADYAAARRFAELVEAETGTEQPDDAPADALAALGRRDPVGSAAWESLKFSTPAAMAAWSRDRPARQAARRTPGLAADAAFLGDRGGYCYYVGELLAAADGTRLTVFAPEQRKAFEVDLEVVRTAAHLFVLLEDALVGDPAAGLLVGPRADPQVAAVARGEANPPAGGSVTIGWHYEYWWGLRPEAAARRSGLHPLAAAMIGVEATVHDLPEVGGRPVILMRPAFLASRSCDYGFFAPLHGDLRSRVTVLRALPPAEVDALDAELRAAAEGIG
jgi:hypothetical protein